MKNNSQDSLNREESEVRPTNNTFHSLDNIYRRQRWFLSPIKPMSNHIFADYDYPENFKAPPFSSRDNIHKGERL